MLIRYSGICTIKYENQPQWKNNDRIEVRALHRAFTADIHNILYYIMEFYPIILNS